MLSQAKIRLRVLFVSTVVAIGAGLGPGVQKTIYDFKPNEYIGLAEYYRLKSGMTLTDVQSILGRGNEIESTNAIATYFWGQPDNSGITVVFEKGKLMQKRQSNLK
jgi:hypothetical protein